MPTDVIVLDHVAVAVDEPGQAWPCFRDALGGRWASTSGIVPGFEFSQVEYAGGMKVEVLAPHAWDENDFLKRFMEHSGPGPHHLTFKVPHLGHMLERCRAMGYRIVGERRDNPNWQEAFLHPKDGAGVVIQLAQQGDDDPPHTVPAHWPGNPEAPQARLEFVAHAVTEFHTHIRRFHELLDGTVATTGHDPNLAADTTDIVWPNGATIRLLRPVGDHSPVAAWLGDRTSRVHHIAFSGIASIRTVIEPDSNRGVRLVLT